MTILSLDCARCGRRCYYPDLEGTEVQADIFVRRFPWLGQIGDRITFYITCPFCLLTQVQAGGSLYDELRPCLEMRQLDSQ